MQKVLNILMILIIVFFIFSTFEYYSSRKNIKDKNYNRVNIDQILKEKIIDLPILINDTNNVIEFNNSIKNDNNDKKPRSFWNLLKN